MKPASVLAAREARDVDDRVAALEEGAEARPIGDAAFEEGEA